jgi:Ca2+-binding RTX toxin-like protein
VRRILFALVALVLGVPAAATWANTSHAGWPAIDGMLLINKQDQARPLDGRPASDPFDGTDFSERCPVGELHSHCVPGGITVNPRSAVTCPALIAAESSLASALGLSAPVPTCSGDLVAAALVPPGIGHNELLGGHGNDTIHAGPAGDVIWGDYKPSGQPTTQSDHLYGGAGNDFIYASHGTNYIYTGGGYDVIHAHFGHGAIHCDSTSVTVYLSRSGRRGWRLFGCRHISYKSLGY